MNLYRRFGGKRGQESEGAYYARLEELKSNIKRRKEAFADPVIVAELMHLDNEEVGFGRHSPCNSVKLDARNDAQSAGSQASRQEARLEEKGVDFLIGLLADATTHLIPAPI